MGGGGLQNNVTKWGGGLKVSRIIIIGMFKWSKIINSLGRQSIIQRQFRKRFANVKSQYRDESV